MKTCIIGKMAAFIAAALLASSCDKGGYDTVFGDGQPSPEILGTYEFDGESYDILTATYAEDESLITFVFSPLAMGDGKDMTTYLSFAIDPYWADGEQHKVNDPAGENLDHQDDYFLVYNDPVHYYSYYREPAGGWFRVSPSGNAYRVELDILLADGTPLKMDYGGEFTAADLK